MKLCEDNHGAYPHEANYYLLRKFWGPCVALELDKFLLKVKTL